ncbi:hypothetical protein NRIC_24390 [Enterococcus florum]|uniref:DUF3788 domain-containing protein n=1 Tax=Enterococcus florum TaxID=2480627 RepID=A0A4P5PEG9_9ENTE|nr:DUF3788 family protein [Enterococcus florum]GCF94548.1 hypothetical protein NRIC_24390 [Enterococcus florum]
MENKWQTKQLKEEKPELSTFMDFLPNSHYLKILLAQLNRHYDPEVKIMFQKKFGWYIEIVQYGGLLCRILVHDDYFSVITPIPPFAKDYLDPMLKVMSNEFKAVYLHTINGANQIEMKVTSEAEMEDVVYLVSLQAKMLRENQIV